MFSGSIVDKLEDVQQSVGDSAAAYQAAKKLPSGKLFQLFESIFKSKTIATHF